MTKGWDWVIGTGLYVAALILSWLTLFSLERFGATDVKAWAPFLQAVLSGAAIYSAWLLQNLKRKQDRESDSRDIQTAMIAHSGHAEWVAAHILDLRLHHRIDQSDAKSYGRQIRDGEQYLKKVDVARLPSGESIKVAIDMAHSLGVIAGMLEVLGADYSTHDHFTEEAFTVAYRQFYNSRTHFLALAKVEPERWRRPVRSLRDTRPAIVDRMFKGAKACDA